MELRQLEYFEAVQRNKNFTHAAAELHVTQPTVTTAIKNLEKELGVSLFDREGGRHGTDARGRGTPDTHSDHSEKCKENLRPCRRGEQLPETGSHDWDSSDLLRPHVSSGDGELRTFPPEY